MTQATIKTLLQSLIADESANADLGNQYTGKVQNRYLVYRMLNALNQRQTESERENEETNVQNGRGFNSSDAALLGNVANRAADYRNLTAKQSRMVAKRLVKYSGQLAGIAAEKSAAKLAVAA